MSRCRTFTRRAALGLLALSTLPCSSSPLLAVNILPQYERQSLDEILTSIFSETYQQLPFYDSCRGLGDETRLDAVNVRLEALYRAGYGPTYIQNEINRNISNLICKDFQENNVVVVDGWFLSQTETAICAIISEKTKFKVSQKFKF